MATRTFIHKIINKDGGMVYLPPNPTIKNLAHPDLTAFDTVQKYELTTKYRFNGKTFVYARSVVYVAATGQYVNARLSAYKGALSGSIPQITWSTTNVHTHAAGVSQIVVEKASVVKDEYKYGHVEVGHAGDTTPQGRGILGNTASSTVSPYPLTLDLDIPLELETVHDTTALELYKSQYAAVEGAISADSYGWGSIVGIPMVNKGGAGLHALNGEWFWLQTWGPCYVQTGSAALGSASGDRDGFFDTQGQIAVEAAHENLQRIGYLITKTQDNSLSHTAAADCFMMLQIDP